MALATVGRWGNNLAVRLPLEVARAAGLRDGERVEIEMQSGEIVIRRAEPVFTLAEMFQDKAADDWRAEYADACRWGPDVGREIVPE